MELKKWFEVLSKKHLMGKAINCKSAAELLLLIKENNLTIDNDKAQNLFDLITEKNTIISDEDLNRVTGGQEIESLSIESTDSITSYSINPVHPSNSNGNKRVLSSNSTDYSNICTKINYPHCDINGCTYYANGYCKL